MAYKRFDYLKKLILLLDDKRNDIFVHIDLKSTGFNEADFKGITKYSKLTFINRKKVFWGDYSQIDVTLDLLKSAGTGYHYYHLMSGMDLPLKTQDEMHSFFDNKNNQFIGIVPNEVWYSVRRLKFYHPFLHNNIYRNSKPLKAFDRVCEYAQKLVGVNRLKNKNIKVVDGWQWWSITEEFCKYILAKRDYIEETFSKSIASDELVFQTMALNSNFRKSIYDESNLQNGSQRLIDWKRGKPYTFKTTDFNELIHSPLMFARKFDPDTDSKIIDKIIIYISQKGEVKNDQ